MNKLFISAIESMNKIRITFFSYEDNRLITRTCASLDYGPSRRSKEKIIKYNLWDYESDKQQHVLSLNPDQGKKIEILDEKFVPSEFVKWDTKKTLGSLLEIGEYFHNKLRWDK